MKTVTLRPSSDIVANWQQIPNDGLAHYLKVDEAFAAHDGDASYIYVPATWVPEQLGLPALPHDFKQSVASRMRAYGRAANAGATIGLAVVVNGIEYSDPLAGFDFSVSPTGQWVGLDTTFTGLPVMTGGEVISIIPYAFPNGGEIRLGQVELEIDYLQHVARPRGDGAGRNPRAVEADPGKPTATAVPRVPTATAVVLTRTATGQVINPPRGDES